MKVHHDVKHFLFEDMIMRIIAFLLLPMLVLGCNSTQNVNVTTETNINEDKVNTKTQVRIRQTPSVATSTKQSSSTLGEGTTQRRSISVPGPSYKMLDKNDIDAVSQHCTKVSYEAVFIKENCKTTSERKICKSAQFGNETFMKEFNYCLTQNGWETY